MNRRQPLGQQHAASAVSYDSGLVDERTDELLEDWTYWRVPRLGGDVNRIPHLCQEVPDRVAPGDPTRFVQLGCLIVLLSYL